LPSEAVPRSRAIPSISAAISGAFVGSSKPSLAYAIGGLLISSGAGGLGAIIICLGIVAHWKWWLLGVGSFLIGVKLG
jgi:hypothetical protein